MLIVDDDRAIRALFERVLLLAGFDVRVASGGAEGLQALGTDADIELVLLDLEMPVIDGWRFRQVQRSDPRLANIPTVVVTGMPLTTTLRDELQATDYLEKPIRRTDLLTIAERYCGRAGDETSSPSRLAS